MSQKSAFEFNYKKATQAINFFARKSPNNQVDKLKVIKLIWLADRVHLRRYGRPITGDIYFAMPLGPVGSTVKDIADFNRFLSEDEKSYAKRFLSNNSGNIVQSIDEVDSSALSQTDMDTLQLVHERLGELSPLKLKDLSHEYPEWSKFKPELDSKRTSRELMSYLDFFGNPSKDSSGIFNEDEVILQENKEMVQEHLAVLDALS